MEDKNASERKPLFSIAFAMIGFGLGILLYALGYNPVVMVAGLSIGIGVGLLIDIMIENRK